MPLKRLKQSTAVALPNAQVEAPNFWLMLMEGRAPWEYAASIAAMPWMRKLPSGDGHPVSLCYFLRDSLAKFLHSGRRRIARLVLLQCLVHGSLDGFRRRHEGFATFELVDCFALCAQLHHFVANLHDVRKANGFESGGEAQCGRAAWVH